MIGIVFSSHSHLSTLPINHVYTISLFWKSIAFAMFSNKSYFKKIFKGEMLIPNNSPLNIFFPINALYLHYFQNNLICFFFRGGSPTEERY